MDQEISDKILTDNDQIYFVTKKGGENGEKNVWGPIILPSGEDSDDFKKQIQVSIGEETVKLTFLKELINNITDSFDIKKSLVYISVFTALISLGYYKYHHDRPDNPDSEDDIDNFENWNEFKESREIDWFIMTLALANILFSTREIVYKILNIIWWPISKILGLAKIVGVGVGKGVVGVGKGVGKRVVGVGKGVVGVGKGVGKVGVGVGKGVVGVGKGVGKGVVGVGKAGVGVGKAGVGLGKAVVGAGKGEVGFAEYRNRVKSLGRKAIVPENTKFKNPLEQKGGGKIDDGMRWILINLITNIPSIIQLMIGIYFFIASYKKLFP